LPRSNSGPRDGAAIGLALPVGLLTGLWAYAVIQPLFDLVARNPQFLGVHDIGAGDLVLLLVILLAPAPLAGALLVAAAGRLNRRFGEILLLVLAGLLLAAGLRPILGRALPAAGWIQVAAALVLGLGISLAVLRRADARRHGRWLGLLAPVLALVFLAQPGPRALFAGSQDPAANDDTPAARAETVVMVVFDALPAASLLDADGRIDAGLYPRWAEFADGAVFYRNALSVSPATLWAVPAILAGRDPEPEFQPNRQSYPANIFTWLEGTHEIHGFEPYTKLQRQGAGRPALTARLGLAVEDLAVIAGHVLLPEDLATGLPPVTNDWKGFVAAARGDHGGGDNRATFRRFLDVLGSAERGGRPGCYVLHAMVPHGPARRLPSGTRYEDDFGQPLVQGDQWGKWRDDPWSVISMQQRYLAQTLFTDRIVGQVIDRLREEGLYDRATVVLCADHGMAFVPGDSRRGASPTNLGAILPVPFLVRTPGGEGGRIDDTPLKTIDILPTVAAALGAELPWSDGLAPAAAAGSQRPDRYLKQEGWVTVDRDTVLQQMQDVVARRFGRFGPECDDCALFAPVRGAGLLDRPVPAALPGRDGLTITLDQPEVRPSPGPGGTVPALVCGFVTSDGPLPDDVDLVIAVDDTVRAVTRPFGRADAGTVALFSSLVPERALGPGEHRYRVLLADWSGGSPVLLEPHMGAMSTLGVNLAHTPMPGLEVYGLLPPRPWNEVPTSWSSGAVNIFLGGGGDGQADALALKLAAVGVPAEPLTVVVNGRPVFHDRVGPGAWNGVIPLDGIPDEEELRIGVFSGTFVPADRDPASRDTRVLGVAVQEISLVRADTAAADVDLESRIILPGDADAVFDGFHEVEPWNGSPVAWTSGTAEIAVPWDGDAYPDGLVLSVAQTGPAPPVVEIAVNDEVVFTRQLQVRASIELVDIAGAPRENPVRIRISTPTFRPADHDDLSTDRRELGIALRRVTLLAAGDGDTRP
jgi:hypothetical protein